MSAPRLARLLIRLSASADRRDDTLGDLEEAHRRRVAAGRLRAWLLTSLEAFVIAAALLWDRVRDLVDGGRLLTRTDLRLGFRLMYRQPVLTLTALVALTVGIALATTGFALMEALLFSRLPFEGGDRFVLIRTLEDPARTSTRLTADEYRLLRAQATLLEHVGALSGGRQNVTLPDGSADVVTTAGLTPTSLGWLPHAPIEGRLFVPDDGQPGALPVVMIREAFWRGALAGRPDVVGTTIDIAGVGRTVVGVVGDEFRFPNTPDIWMPIGEVFFDGRGQAPSNAGLFAVIAPGRTLESVQDQLDAVAADISAARGGDRRIAFEARGFTDLGPQADVMATVVIVVVVAVLAVIAANVGNLILARSFSRTREFALRAALGASRRQLVGQVFVEVLLIAGLASVVGSVSARAAMRQFNAMDEIPFWVDFSGGPWTTALVVGSTLLAAAIAGAWPALRATRRSLVQAIHTDGARSGDVRFGRLAGVMVVAQIAVSIVMLHGALVMAEGFAAYTEPPVDLPGNVLTTSLGINAVRPSPDGQGRVQLTAEDVEDIVERIPGVLAAGLSTALPRHSPPALPIEIDPPPGRTAAAPELAPSAEVSRGFFDALDADLIAGRLFMASDYSPGAPAVAVVNEPFARRFFGDTLPVGHRFRVIGADGAGPWRTIVGVVPDLALSLGDTSLASGYYVPLSADTNFVYLALRVAGEPGAWANPLRRALLDRDPQLVLNRIEPLVDVAGEDRTFFAIATASLIGLGIITLVLALAGVYAMMALIVTRRTREIGVRVALGATTSRIVRSVVGRAAWQVGLGAGAGSLLALLSLDARAVLVSRLGDGGPWALPGVVALLVLAGLAATWLPLRRALRIRPADALRAE